MHMHRLLLWRPRPNLPPPLLLLVSLILLSLILVTWLDALPRQTIDHDDLIYAEAGPKSFVPPVAWSPDGTRFVAGRQAGLCCVDARSGRILGRLPPHDRLRDLTDAKLAADGAVLAIRRRLGSLGFELIRWDPGTNQVTVLKRENRRSADGRISADGRWLILTTNEPGKKRTLVHDVTQQTDVLTLDELPVNAAAAVFAQGDAVVQVRQGGIDVRVFDAAGQVQGQLAGPANFGPISGTDVQLNDAGNTLLVSWRGTRRVGLAICQAKPFAERFRQVVELKEGDHAWATLQTDPGRAPSGWVLLQNYLHAGCEVQVFNGEDKPLGRPIRFAHMTASNARLYSGGSRLAIIGNVLPDHTPWWFRLREAPSKLPSMHGPKSRLYADVQVIDMPSGGVLFRRQGEVSDPRQLSMGGKGEQLTISTPAGVEVWEIPAGRPWLRIVGGALGGTLVLAIALTAIPLLLRGRRTKSPREANHP
jgi:hypothetical protein